MIRNPFSCIHGPVIAWVLGWLCLQGSAFCESIDPRNPDELRELERTYSDKWSTWPGSRVRQLELEQENLLEALAQLPQRHPMLSQNRLGYHSRFKSDGSLPENTDHLIDFHLGHAFSINAIGIVPAVNPTEPGSAAYAFPSRFSIEVLEPSGAISTVVDWSDEDFPEPGQLPVMFSDFDFKTDHIRFRIPRSPESSSRSFFALGEVFIWGGGMRGQLDNVTLWEKTKVTTTNSFSLPPMWDLNYLHDGVSGLGFPLHRKQEGRTDLMIFPENETELAEKVRLVVDLGSPTHISRFDLWPAQSEEGLAFSGVGFPGSVSVEVSTESGFANFRAIEPQEYDIERNESGALYSVCVKSPGVRFVRLTLDNLQRLNGKRILGLGEIALYDIAGNLVSGKIVGSEGIPSQYDKQLPLLVDGFCWGRQILPDLEWMKGLAQRRPLEQQLATVEEALISARAVWQYLQIRLIIGIAIVVTLVLVAVVVFQRLQRKWVLMRQGDRITRDLHDEVGSSLGSIALLADELAENGRSHPQEGDLGDLSLMAREANASLRDIVRAKDQEAVILPELIDSLQERAERVLRGVSVQGRIAPNLPPIPVSLSVKRHLVMFFKEAIHNCARHAKAERATLDVDVDGDHLRLAFSDDGCGFGPSLNSNGWGLGNLRQRADEIRGSVSIESHPGKGTTVTLLVPLSMLSKEPEFTYQSSNQ